MLHGILHFCTNTQLESKCGSCMRTAPEAALSALPSLWYRRQRKPHPTAGWARDLQLLCMVRFSREISAAAMKQGREDRHRNLVQSSSQRGSQMGAKATTLPLAPLSHHRARMGRGGPASSSLITLASASQLHYLLAENMSSRVVKQVGEVSWH